MTQTHAEHQRTYRRKHPDRAKESTRKWRAANAEKYADTVAVWKLEHPESVAKYRAKYSVCRQLYREIHADVNLRWIAENREKCRSYARAHKARRAGSSGSHTAADINAQYERQRGRCFYCDERVGKKYHVDHVTPLVKKGSNGPENLVITCPTCNLSKGAKHPMDFAGVMC